MDQGTLSKCMDYVEPNNIILIFGKDSMIEAILILDPIRFQDTVNIIK